MRTLLATRLASRLVGPRLTARMVPGWILLLFLWVQLEDILDWPAIAVWMTGLAPWTAGLLVATLAGIWSLLWAPAFREALLGPRLALLWRQPLGQLSRSVVLVPLVLGVGLPLALASQLVLAPHPLLRACLWLAVVPLPLLGLASASLRYTALGLGSAFLAVGLGHAWPGVLPVLAPAALLGASVSLGPVHARVWRPLRVWRPRLGWRPRRPLGAVLRRDLLVLVRAEPRVALLALLPLVLVASALSALHAHGGVQHRGLVVGALVYLAFSAPLGLLPVMRLARRLGPQLDPPTWPVPPWMRALGLVMVGSLAMSPAWAGTLPHVGPALEPLALTLLCGAGAALLAALDSDFGSWLWWVLAGLGLAVLPPPLGWMAAGLAALATTALLSRALARRRSLP